MPASATADSLARSVPRSTMDQLRNDSQRKAESTSAHRVALGQQQELEPESLEQQLKSNEACGYERGTIGVLSQAAVGGWIAAFAPCCLLLRGEGHGKGGRQGKSHFQKLSLIHI